MPDLAGMTIGRLTVLEFAEVRAHVRYWSCRCQCGSTTLVSTSHIRRARVRSCGCLGPELRRKHGGHGSRLYRIWADMKARCRRPTHQKYPRYGALGINYDPAWERYEAFERWATTSGYRPGLHLARQLSSAGYAPANCRWRSRWQRPQIAAWEPSDVAAQAHRPSDPSADGGPAAVTGSAPRFFEPGRAGPVHPLSSANGT